jgi:CubicO group peptidase (beta-lactamase class C family)
LFTPGTAYNYSNTNYILLGLVMEQVTGKTASELFKERLFDPLGLKDTTLPTLDDASIPSVYAHGYMFATAEKAGGPDPALCGVELMPHCDDLKGKAQSVAIAASRLDQPPVLVVQVEEPFQLDPRVGAEPAVAALSDHARHDHRRPTPLTIQPLAPDLGRMSLNPRIAHEVERE